MADIDRRSFMGALALAGLAPQALPSGLAGRVPGQEKAAPPTDVTRTLARWLVSARPEDLPEAVRKEARRTFVNYVGCALGGSPHPTLDIAIGALAPFWGPEQASVLGRAERTDIFNAALLNGMSSHVLDYDDTHLKSVIHPGGPVLSAILALAEYRPVNGRDFLHAMVMGVEAECRIGNAVYPDHYDRGWHITGTTGPFGAAAAAGKLLGLTEQQMVWALGIAATQPVGLREMFGTMTKSFHPGRAAQNGLLAALLASQGFTSTDVGLEGKSGWANVLSTKQDWAEITGGLGERYEILLNTYKPFPCGIVLHPTIDACLQLRAEHALAAGDIERIDLSVHPLVLELTGKKTPQTGLEGKFSVYFTAAVAIVAGTVGVKQFSDETVRDPVVVALRDRVVAIADPAVGEEQVRAVVTLKDGRRFEKFIEHVVGSVEKPMSDAALEGKFLDLADGVLPQARARALLALCWRIEELTGAAEVAQAGRA
jgi:2-methylcitrate dehydratase PrpD